MFKNWAIRNGLKNGGLFNYLADFKRIMADFFIFLAENGGLFPIEIIR